MSDSTCPNALQHLYAERLPKKIHKIRELWKQCLKEKWNKMLVGQLESLLKQLMDNASAMDMSTVHDLTKDVYQCINQTTKSTKPPDKEQQTFFNKRISMLEDVIDVQILALKVLKSYDQTTGLPNKTTMMERLDIESSRANRQSSDLCLAVVRIDDAHRIEEASQITFDELQDALILSIKHRIRKTDIIGHFTHAKIAIILSETDLKEAELIMHEIQQNYQARYANAEPYVTISISVVLKTALSNALSLSSACRQLLDNLSESSQLISKVEHEDL